IVKRCSSRKTGQLYAVKIVSLSNFNQKQQEILRKHLKREEEVSVHLKHPLVQPMLEIYNSDEYYYILYNHLEGSDLCLEIVSRASSGFVYSEAVASHYMKQILEGIRFIHSKDIIHRRLTMSCLCLASKENSSPVKICSFEGATCIEELENTQEYGRDGIGMASTFPSPEMIQMAYYGKPVDVWSAGCILYTLLSGYPPFLGEREQRDRAALNGVYSLTGRQWDVISEEAKNLIRRMLDVDPTRRITADEALAHPWIKERSHVPKLHLSETVKCMLKFNEYRGLKKKKTKSSLSFHMMNSILILYHLIVGGGQVILDCIEGIEALENCDHVPLEIFEDLMKDNRFNFYLQVFESINSRLLHLSSSAQSDSLARQVNEVSEGMKIQIYNLVDEVNNIFTQVHLQNMITVHDLLAGKRNSLAELRLADHNTLKSSNSNSSSSNNNTVDKILRVRLVQFQKNTDEPMGITFKLTSDGRCMVSRIMDGGLIHRHGTLHVGDQILEINGQTVDGLSLENMQRLVRECRGNVSFKILQTSRSQPMHSEVMMMIVTMMVSGGDRSSLNVAPFHSTHSNNARTLFVRALFSYDPNTDPYIPSRQAGLKFEVGDILRVVCQDDSLWWQARHWNSPKNSPAKLLPSPEQQEYRVAEEDRKKKKNNGDGDDVGSGDDDEMMIDKYLVKHNSLFDQLELNTYEEVIRLPSFLRKTLVLLGAHGVGRRHIKNLFITRQSYKYAYPIPHTTRQPRPDEEHGRNYFFISHEQMTAEIADNQYLEYGTHEGAIYGTKLETIRQIHRQGLVAILDIEPQALKILRTAEYAPFVVFIAAPTNIALMNDSSLERLARESNYLEQTYRHTFDLKIVNNDIDETIRELEIAMEHVNKNPQWVPVGWVY
ncbi:hypothetical protein HELRODRAFT_69265, partial [Helobdella robusta]|uniref:Non-specific serine/threonine protein kinase n=1 Tax=Helobdella robusta TaxID=6412 RepID=T1FZS2_HELRO